MAASNFQNRHGGTSLNGLNPEPLPLGMELPLICTVLLIGDALLLCCVIMPAPVRPSPIHLVS